MGFAGAGRLDVGILGHDLQALRELAEERVHRYLIKTQHIHAY